jgi:hypothetical protein
MTRLHGWSIASLVFMVCTSVMKSRQEEALIPAWLGLRIPVAMLYYIRYIRKGNACILA